MALQETLEAVKRRELAARLDQGEAEVLAKVAEQLPEPPGLDSETREHLAPFLQWTTEKSCRYAPAKSFVVAAFVIDQASTGASTGAILARVNAISILHDRHSLADPTATTVVRAVLADVVAAPAPPRSWTKSEKQMFTGLPVAAQSVIARREADRETQMRRAQNEAGELRNALKRLQTAADAMPVETSEKVNTNE
jgi:hypothetical protein